MTERYDAQDLRRLRRFLTTFDLVLVGVGAAVALTGSVAAGLGIAATGACAWCLARFAAR